MRKKIPIFFWNFFKQLDEMFVHFQEHLHRIYSFIFLKFKKFFFLKLK